MRKKKIGIRLNYNRYEIKEKEPKNQPKNRGSIMLQEMKMQGRFHNSKYPPLLFPHERFGQPM